MLSGHLNNGLNDFMLASSITVRNLRVIFDQDMSFKQHINQVCKTALFHLRNISKIRRSILSQGDVEKLIHVFVTSRLDYCNALLAGCPKDSLNSLQLIQNATVSADRNLQTRSRVSCVSLPPLPIKFRIEFKILVLAYKALHS